MQDIQRILRVARTVLSNTSNTDWVGVSERWMQVVLAAGAQVLKSEGQPDGSYVTEARYEEVIFSHTGRRLVAI